MATLASYDPALKQLYMKELVEFLVYKRRPMTALLSKKENMGGRNTPLPTIWGNTQGRSHTFSEAQGNVTNSSMDDFLITTVENHSLAHISSKVVASTIDDKKAFVPALKLEMDSAMNSLADSIESEIPRSGTASLGQVASTATVSNQTIALEDINDIVNIEPGMVIRGTSTDGGAYDVGEEVVAAVDRVSGEITATSAAWNTVMTDLAASDYLVVSGDGAQGGANLGLTGFASWFPSTDPSASESFFGVDRSDDSRKWGTYYDGSTGLVEEALIHGQSLAAQLHGGAVDTYIVNNAQYRKLNKELGSKVQYTKSPASSGSGKAEVSFRGINVEGDFGPIAVVAANKCQSTIAWGICKENCFLFSIGPMVRIDDTDGNRILRRSSASGVEARFVSWGQFCCNAPGQQCHVALGSA